MSRENIIKGISIFLGVSYEKIDSMISDYEQNSLTPEMDANNFEALLYMVINAQNSRVVMKKFSLMNKLMNKFLPLTLLNDYAGHSYSVPSDPLSLRMIVENIVPFLVINNLFKVFIVKAIKNKHDGEQKYYLVVQTDTRKNELSNHLEKIGWKVTTIEEVS